ncbi:MAG: SRPBCC family protein [Pseudomonadota bacterium]|nr:SRPBCC family protein [Pseudomonadota bacterium]
MTPASSASPPRAPIGAAHADPARHPAVVSRVLAPAWHLAPPAPDAPGSWAPFVLSPGSLDEPLLRVRDEDGVARTLSNVCTHRGMVLAACPGHGRRLRCGYHGRRFRLDGALESAPGFDGTPASPTPGSPTPGSRNPGFPGPDDSLPVVPEAEWGPLSFVSLAPDVPFADWIAPIRARLDGLYTDALVHDPAGTREWIVAAPWALYLDNYLEGLHIPYVHRSLDGALAPGGYRIHLSPHGSLQVGEAASGEPAFDLPAGHPEAGRRIAAFWFHLFPTTLVNAYPWGLSVNVVEPLGPDRTRVRFLSWVARPDLRSAGAGADLDRVEHEDEVVVEAVAHGVRSRLYRGGGYAPGHEDAVAHFHGLLRERAGA